MKLRLEYSPEIPDENGNVFSESVIESIADSARGVPLVLDYESHALGFVRSARRNGNFLEIDAKLDETKPETEFFEKEHIVYSVRCSYQDLDFEQTGNVRTIKSARLRAIKAEGGWAVVSTEETEIHPTADCEPFHEGRLWDDRDLPAMALMADAVHEYGALAAIEIMHHGASAANWGTRLAPLSPSHRPIIYYSPVQARAMFRRL